MFTIVPVLTLTLILTAINNKKSSFYHGYDLRRSFLDASVIWGVTLVFITEILSLFRLIVFQWILGAWIGAAVIAGLFCFSHEKIRRPAILRINKINLTPSTSFFIIGIVFIVCAVGLTALIAPPNTWDSMTYHMARVVHWIQNHSLANYPTSIDRQLFMNPWAEYAIMNFQILSSGDRFVNLIQWFGMFGCIIGVSLIAKLFEAAVPEQIFAALICATIPMGILQGSSTQTDYVCAFWLTIFVYHILAMSKEGIDKANFLTAGASLGLAILTKGTAYIYAAPLVILLFFYGRRYARRNVWKTIMVIIAIALFINAGYYARCLELFNRPGFKKAHSYFNTTFTASAFISNITRNLTLHTGTQNKAVNFTVEKGVRSIHALLKTSPDDKRTTYANRKYYAPKLSLHEDTAGNPAHLLLIFIAVTLFLFKRTVGKELNIGGYLFSLMGMFLIFCFLLKWQPWHSRYHLPIFVLFSPLIALTLSRTIDYRAVNLTGILLILFSFPWVFYNQSRPLMGKKSIFCSDRTTQLFNNRPNLKEPYMKAAQFIKSINCGDLGLSMHEDDWEYPIWVLLKEDGRKAVHIEHINVNNMSQKIPYLVDFKPCAVMSLTPSAEEKITYGGALYLLKFKDKPVSVYVRDDLRAEHVQP